VISIAITLYLPNKVYHYSKLIIGSELNQLTVDFRLVSKKNLY